MVWLSLNWFKFSYEIVANWEGLYHQLASDPTINLIIQVAAALLPIIMLSCIFLYKKTRVNVHVIEEMIKGEISAADAVYAEEMQILETLYASLITSETSNTDTTNILEKEPGYSFCEICLENKPDWQMFTNDTCSHSFCNECTTSHIVVKVKDRVEKIPCPSLNCKAILNFEACRLMIPIEMLVQWDELLCMSLIPESQKLYCPFLDCSALLVNDFGEVITRIKCVICKRLFCGDCLVPWHSEFTCKEFKKLRPENGGKEDEMVKTLAEKKSWKRCPECKMYVEKKSGCVHITCRCNYKFCYGCGEKWAYSHYNSCSPRL